MTTEGKVLYVTRYVPAYRIPILNQLNEALNGNLVVCAGDPPHASSVLKARESQTELFERIQLKNHFWWGDKVHFQNFEGVFERYPNPRVVIAEDSPRSISLPFLLRRARANGAGRVLWGIFYSVHRPFSARHPIQFFRLRMARRVDACACYTKSVRARLSSFVDPSRLFLAQNTLDTQTLSGLRQDLKREGRVAIRERLTINIDDAVLVFVGQLLPRKGTRELLDVFQRIQSDTNATLLVIGDGPDLEPMREIVIGKDLRNVHFLGALPLLEESCPYIYSADVTVIPGYVGLVANHSFGLGVPLVTMEAPGEAPFHGPEVESVIDGENGFITKRAISSLESGIRRVLKDRDIYSENALRYAEQHLTSEGMVQGLVDAIEFADINRTQRLTHV